MYNTTLKYDLKTKQNKIYDFFHVYSCAPTVQVRAQKAPVYLVLVCPSGLLSGDEEDRKSQVQMCTDHNTLQTTYS